MARNLKFWPTINPFTGLFKVKDPGSRLVRWRLKLEEYGYEICYKSGTQISNADVLSRITPYHCNNNQTINSIQHIKPIKTSLNRLKQN